MSVDRYDVLPLLLIFLSLTNLIRCSPAPVDVMIVGFGSLAPYGVPSMAITGPTYEVAVEELQRKYNSTFNFTYVFPGAHTCLSVIETDGDDLSKWYYQFQVPGKIVIFVSPGTELGCWEGDASVFSLTGNWNALSLNTITGMDIKRSLLSTSLSLSYVCATSYITLGFNLLRKYKWKSVFILLDESSAPINTFMALATAERVTRIRWSQVLHQMTSNKNTTFADELMRFRNISRVLFFYGHAAKLRQLLITAELLNMTDGQYVYIATEIFPYEFAYGKLTWNYNDENDQFAEKAFRSLVILQPLNKEVLTSSEASLQLGNEFRRRSKANFNFSYSMAQQALPVMIASYGSILMLGQVLHESLETGQNLYDGRQIASRFLNRTFQTEFGDVFIDSSGTRIENLAVTHFDSKSGQREPFLAQYANALDILETYGQIEWPGSQWPPPNEPYCGYRGEKNICKNITAVSNGVLYGVIAVCMVGITIGAIKTIKRFAIVSHELWWSINTHELLSLKLLGSKIHRS